MMNANSSSPCPVSSNVVCFPNATPTQSRKAKTRNQIKADAIKRLEAAIEMGRTAFIELLDAMLPQIRVDLGDMEKEDAKLCLAQIHAAAARARRDRKAAQGHT
ncbi:MAG: hypothetical protein WC091_07350 [Sulfuricellaceae bacterium]